MLEKLYECEKSTELEICYEKKSLIVRSSIWIEMIILLTYLFDIVIAQDSPR